MATIYLVQQGTTLRKEQGRFLIETDLPDEEMPNAEVLIQEVERILVFGTIHLTTAAISVCLDHHIPVIFLSQSGDYKGHLWSAEFADLDAEIAQFRLRENPGFQMDMARRIVQGKLWNSRQLLMKLNRKRKSAEVGEAIAGINRDWKATEQLETIAELDRLRGYEGVAAARYFPALGKLITNSEFSLTQRTSRPPTDPINSQLSFGYTLLFNNVLSLILAEGLNPYIGNLHRSDRKEAHLASDLVEEFRSTIVDSLVLQLVNQKVLQTADFTSPNEQGGVYLTDSARRVFLKQFEARITSKTSHPDVQKQVSYRRVIQLQVKRYKQALTKAIPYEPYRRVT